MFFPLWYCWGIYTYEEILIISELYLYVQNVLWWKSNLINDEEHADLADSDSTVHINMCMLFELFLK